MITCTFENGNQNSLRHVVADMIVLRDDEVLLVKRAAHLLSGGKWAIVGGYVERDETIAETAEREILEETGWEVKDLTLLVIRDSPKRPKEDRQNIAFVYFCTATKKVGEPDDESDEQSWFKLSALPPEDNMAFDHLDDIKLYQRYLKEKLSLPIIG